jgi:hypothetical protein
MRLVPLRDGVTDETCQAYTAKDGTCDALHFCQNCDPPPSKVGLYTLS